MKVKCRFCGTTFTMSKNDVKRKGGLEKLKAGPPTACRGDKDTLSPPHLEIVKTWDEHYEVLEQD